jgi:hypothetical protein
MMADWADFLSGMAKQSGKVVSIGFAK